MLSGTLPTLFCCLFWVAACTVHVLWTAMRHKGWCVPLSHCFLGKDQAIHFLNTYALRRQQLPEMSKKYNVITCTGTVSAGFCLFFFVKRGLFSIPSHSFSCTKCTYNTNTKISSERRANYNYIYYTTKVVRGPITEFNQSDYFIAGPIFSKYRTGYTVLNV